MLRTKEKDGYVTVIHLGVPWLESKNTTVNVMISHGGERMEKFTTRYQGENGSG